MPSNRNRTWPCGVCHQDIAKDDHRRRARFFEVCWRHASEFLRRGGVFMRFGDAWTAAGKKPPVSTSVGAETLLPCPLLLWDFKMQRPWTTLEHSKKNVPARWSAASAEERGNAVWWMGLWEQDGKFCPGPFTYLSMRLLPS